MLDYQIKDKDTGIAADTSIQPYNNGEAAEQTQFRRTPENLRTRSEVLRETVDEMRAVASLDRSTTIMVAPEGTVTWGGAKDINHGSGLGTGIPVLANLTGVGGSAANCLVVQSLMSNAKLLDNASPAQYVVGNDAIPISLSRSSGGADLGFESLKRPWENGNNIFMRVHDVGAPQVPTVIVTVGGTLDGSGNPVGPVTIDVSMSNSGTIDPTCQDVVDAVNAHASAQLLVSAVTPSGALTAFEIKDATDSNKGVPLEGGADSESFQILVADWVNFFSLDTLREGETLVFAFENAEERRKTGGGIPWSTLRILRDSELVDNANVVPICKVIQDMLVFMNGVSVRRGETVRLMPDQHLRPDLAVETGTPGDTLVGGAAKTNVVTLAQGTVAAQMHEFLGFHGTLENEYDAHVGGTADKHPVKDITGRPFVVVGVGGDYTNLATAVTTLAAGDGGTIFVREGIYEVNIDITALNSSVRIVGKPGGQFADPTLGVVVRPATATSPAIQCTDATPTGKLIFEHIKFVGNHSTNIEVVKFPYGGAAAGIEFRDCHFHKLSGSTTNEMVESGCSTTFRDCRMRNNTSAEDLPFFVGFAPTGHANEQRFVFNNCEWNGWGELVRLGGVGEPTVGQFEFTHNIITGCGNTSGDSTPGLLIATESTDMAQIHITHNTWAYDSGAAATENGRFCDVRGYGVIANNYLKHGIRRATLNSGYACITVLGAGGRVIIRGNTIDGYDAGCVRVDDNCSVVHNECDISNNDSETSPIIIVGNDVVCSNNEIDFDPTTTPTKEIAGVDMSIADVNKVIVRGNNINISGGAEHVGVLVGDLAAARTVANVTVDGNVITGTTSNYGIVYTGSSATYGTIVNNTIMGTKKGIYAIGTYIVANNNTVKLYNTAGAIGIDFSTSTKGTIIGNLIYGNNPTADTGIKAAGSDVAIAGNSVLNVATSFTSNNTCGIGTTGTRDTTHNLY